jgi:hypothetical protein
LVRGTCNSSTTPSFSAGVFRLLNFSEMLAIVKSGSGRACAYCTLFPLELQRRISLIEHGFFGHG